MDDRTYLLENYWEELGNGRWSHPGHAVTNDPTDPGYCPEYERGGFTTEEAVASMRAIDAAAGWTTTAKVRLEARMKSLQ